MDFQKNKDICYSITKDMLSFRQSIVKESNLEKDDPLVDKLCELMLLLSFVKSGGEQ